MDQAIQNVVNAVAKDIVDWVVNQNISLYDAINKVKSGTSLGPKTFAQAVEQAKDRLSCE